MTSEGMSVLDFDQVEANPRHTTVNEMADQARAWGADSVVGLGGGSVLDAAKAAAMLLTNEGDIRSFEGRNQYAERPAPFVALPTTCGTGSEVTWVSVISVEDDQTKISVKGETMFPDVALVDSDFLTTLPPSLVAWTGVDALTHAIEAYIGTEANPASDALAEKAVGLLCRYLPRAVTDIEGTRDRDAVMRASTLAGMAFGNADVGAVHCLSETIGGIWDIPHGLGNAVLLAPVLRYHKNAARLRLAQLHRIALGEPTGDGAEAMIRAIEDLVETLGVPSFSTFEIPLDQLPRIAEGATRNNSNSSNPQPMGPEQYLEILSGLTVD